MFLLPTFNATLSPCPVSRAEFASHPQGYFCGQCQRVVHDFSQSTNPRADLAAARAAAPDGRVCGRVGAAQVQALPALSRRLRWFVMALVLVVAQGLTAREALAQVRQTGPGQPQAQPVKKRPASSQIVTATLDGVIAAPEPGTDPGTDPNKVYTYAGQMPSFWGKDQAGLNSYIQQQIHWPKGAADIEGRIFVSFIVGKDGVVRDAKVVKGLHPLLDAEGLRIIRALKEFAPGRQNGVPVAVSITVPITFRRE